MRCEPQNYLRGAQARPDYLGNEKLRKSLHLREPEALQVTRLWRSARLGDGVVLMRVIRCQSWLQERPKARDRRLYGWTAKFRLEANRGELARFVAATFRYAHPGTAAVFRPAAGLHDVLGSIRLPLDGASLALSRQAGIELHGGALRADPVRGGQP